MKFYVWEIDEKAREITATIFKKGIYGLAPISEEEFDHILEQHPTFQVVHLEEDLVRSFCKKEQ